MKKVEGRQGRRFSLINLRSSAKPKNVSLSPTVTVLETSRNAQPIQTPLKTSDGPSHSSSPPLSSSAGDALSLPALQPLEVSFGEVPTGPSSVFFQQSATAAAQLEAAQLDSVSRFDSSAQLSTISQLASPEKIGGSAQLTQPAKIDSIPQLLSPIKIDGGPQLTAPVKFHTYPGLLSSSSAAARTYESSQLSSPLQQLDTIQQPTTSSIQLEAIPQGSSPVLQLEESSPSPPPLPTAPTPTSTTLQLLSVSPTSLHGVTSTPTSTCSTSHLHLVPTSTTLHLLSASAAAAAKDSRPPTLELVTASKVSPQTLEFVSSPSASTLQLFSATAVAKGASHPTLELVPAKGSPQTLELVSAASPQTLQLVPSASVVQRVPSFSLQRVAPALCAPSAYPSSPPAALLSPSTYTHSSSSQSPCAAVVEKTPSSSSRHRSSKSRGRSPSRDRSKRDRSSSKSKEKKGSPRKCKATHRNEGGCSCGHGDDVHYSHRCHHKKRDSVDSEESGCLLDGETELTKKEVLNKYRLHIFVAFLFTLIVIFISLGWYFKDLFREQERSKQKIFIDPATRVLTLADGRDKMQIFMGRDLPGWQLPLHCPPQPDGNPNSKSCEWKNNAIVHVHYFVLDNKTPEGDSTGYNAHCYNVSWETLHPDMVPYDCFDVGSAVWYGPSNQSEETLPIGGQFSYVPSPYRLDNSGIFSSVVDLYWLSSSGVGLLLNPEDPLTLQWNTTSPGRMCVISNFTGPLYTDTSTSPTMNYTICNGPDPVKTHLLMKGMLMGGLESRVTPDLSMIGPPQWSVSGLALTPHYDQHNVLDLITRFKMHGLNCSMLMLDGDWQRRHGDLTFDPDRFANLTNLTDNITNTCSLGLQVTPYFDYRSLDNFHEGVSNGLFVKDAGGQAPGLTGWQSGPAVAMLDVSLDSARAWFTSKLTSILAESRAKGVRLSYGGAGWLPFKATFSQSGLSMFQLRRRMSHMVSSLSDMLVLEHTSGSQSLPGLVAVPTGLAVREGRSCLVHSIEAAVTLGLLGYPYVLADGFGRSQGSKYQSSFRSNTPQPSKDLFIRWMQMAAFFPALQFSLPPWSYDVNNGQTTATTTTKLAASLSELHVEVMTLVLGNDKVIRELKEGLPLMRPVWWLDAGNATLHSLRISDQFLLGDQVLVAPVLCEGVTKRNIYVPPGVWKDKLRGAVVVGPKLLEAYPVAQHQVAYFLRMKTYDDHDIN